MPPNWGRLFHQIILLFLVKSITNVSQKNQPQSSKFVHIPSDYPSVTVTNIKENALNKSENLPKQITLATTTTIRTGFTSNRTEISSSLVVLSIGKNFQLV